MICVGFIVHIHIPCAHSLKEKRAVLSSVVSRLRSRFNGSFMQGGPRDAWQLAEIGCAIVANSAYEAQAKKDAILDFLQSDGRFEVLETELL
jgi:uncharacterized protein YlxP (DUF503 family)